METRTPTFYRGMDHRWGEELETSLRDVYAAFEDEGDGRWNNVQRRRLQDVLRHFGAAS